MPRSAAPAPGSAGHKVTLGTVRPRARNSGWYVTFNNWMVNEGRGRIFFALFLLAQLGYFVYSWWQLWTAKNLATFRSVLVYGLPTARAAANVLNLDCGIILFTVCRNLISLLRTTFLGRIVPFDKNITFHIWIAYSIVFWTLVHVVAHYFNYNNVRISLGVSAEYLSLVSGPGWTGQVISVAFFLMVTSALEAVRRKHFEIFWFTHHLFLVFFGGLLMHGSFCFIKADFGDPCRGGPTFWKFWVGSGACYLLERLWREVRGRRKTFISKIVQHPSKVCEVQIKKEGWKMEAGQYIFLSCPEVGLFEWHPFTLTSSPHEEFLSVHIRVVGDWTTKFAKRVGCRFGDPDEKDMAPPTSLPFVMVDGPYGSASEDVFDYEASILVGAGIGVTPFASILKTIWFRINNPTRPVPLKKVYFFWICRDKDAFEWFQDLLSTIEDENMDNFLEIHTYLTQKLKISEVKNILLNDGENGRDALTGLRARTHYGRPNWDQIFESIRIRHPATDVGVFFCGPKVLSRTLHASCNKWTDASEDGTRFYYGKENF
ncbi:ferric reductase NAD binding domain-containing protein [Entophlyctis helioformis]|nr:ferric reductase NAD binding domain-containing protein [Entophlyctis helioformis]